MSIENKIAIITGAWRGIGLATALRFAREGAKVVLFSRSADNLDEVASEIRGQGGKALAVAGDVSREEDVRRLFEQAMAAYGRGVIWVNGAGKVEVGPFVELVVPRWNRGLNGTCAEPFSAAWR